MDDRTALRTGGIAGIAFAVLLFLANVGLGSPPMADAPLKELTEFSADKAGALRLGMLLAALGAAAFMVFFGIVLALLRSREGAFAPSTWAAAITGAATIICVLISLIASFSTGFASGPGGNEEAVRAMVDFGAELGTAANVTGCVCVLILALAARRYRLLPSWAVTIAFVAAALLLVGSFGLLADEGAFVPGGPLAGLLPTAGVFAWVISWSVALLRGRVDVAAD